VRVDRAVAAVTVAAVAVARAVDLSVAVRAVAVVVTALAVRVVVDVVAAKPVVLLLLLALLAVVVAATPLTSATLALSPALAHRRLSTARRLLARLPKLVPDVRPNDVSMI
jgi:hypothetical protein